MKMARTVTWTVSVFVLSVGLLGCGGEAENPSAVNPLTQERPQTPELALTVGTFTNSLAHAPLYAALHFKWFEDEPNLKGVRINYKDFNDRPTISQAFASGSLDALLSAEIPQILCRAQGDDIRIVMLTTWATQEILIQNDIPVSSFASLRGRTLAVLAGTSSHYAVLKADGGQRDDPN